MLSVLCALVMSVQDTDVTLEPSDDVWVYQFAEDQTSDEFLRAWGCDDGAVGKSFEGSLNFSFSCLKFKPPMPLPNTKLKSAKLVLTHVPDAGWAVDSIDKHPLEARSMTGTWDEQSWAYEKAAKVHPLPEANAVFGTGWAKPSGDKPFKIEIDLMKGPGNFEKTFQDAINDPKAGLSIALTTTLLPDGENSVYKLYSKSNEADLRPKLVLGFGSGRP